LRLRVLPSPHPRDLIYHDTCYICLRLVLQTLKPKKK